MKQLSSNSHPKLVRLGEVAKTSSGGTPSRGVPTYLGGDIPWVKSGELGDSTVYDTQEKITRAALNGCLLVGGASWGDAGFLVCLVVTG
jgi:hypothetical protein